VHDISSVPLNIHSIPPFSPQTLLEWTILQVYCWYLYLFTHTCGYRYLFLEYTFRYGMELRVWNTHRSYTLRALDIQPSSPLIDSSLLGQHNLIVQLSIFKKAESDSTWNVNDNSDNHPFSGYSVTTWEPSLSRWWGHRNLVLWVLEGNWFRETLAKSTNVHCIFIILLVFGPWKIKFELSKQSTHKSCEVEHKIS